MKTVTSAIIVCQEDNNLTAYIPRQGEWIKVVGLAEKLTDKPTVYGSVTFGITKVRVNTKGHHLHPYTQVADAPVTINNGVSLIEDLEDIL
jgi:hypothetical protein